MVSRDNMQLCVDDIDWRIIEALQEDARQSFTALGNLIGLSRPAVAERVHRLEEAGVITGYHAQIAPSLVGRAITAFVRIRTPTLSDCDAIRDLLLGLPEVQEAHRSVGEDCYIVKLAVTSIAQLDAILARIYPYSSTNTTITLSTLVPRRAITRNGAHG